MSYAASKYTFGKSVPRSKESIAAEIAKINSEWKRYEANRAFLDKVAEGEAASHKARFEEAQAKKAAQQYPFQGQTFDPNPSTFQPQSSRPSYSSNGW